VQRVIHSEWPHPEPNGPYRDQKMPRNFGFSALQLVI
jgi:hypothetical protein